MLPSELSQRLETRLRSLYGNERAAETLASLLELIERWRTPIATSFEARGDAALQAEFSERDAVLIAYGDHLQRAGESPLATLGGWCREHLRGCLNTIHVLPFHPSTSYEGYAITDYVGVDPALGAWSDLERLGEDFGLMMDLVLNHCSASHPWFQQFLGGEEPGNQFFITNDPDAPWLKDVKRARNLPLLHPFETARGTQHVWTTYSPDLVDLNWREPTLCLEFLGILLESVARGMRVVRLDAHVYVWKEEGTSCVNRPANHELVRLFQDVLAAAGAGAVTILPSITNVTQGENFEYLDASQGRQADFIYHLPLSALLLQALYSDDATTLSGWIRSLPAAPPGCAYLNLAASHDGVGLSWLEGLIPGEAIDELIAGAVLRGAKLSSRKRTVTDDDRPWELNITYFSACAPPPGEGLHVERFLATQGIVLALRGVPALYLSILLAGTNDAARVEETGDNRAINRGRFDADAWDTAATTDGSPQRQVLNGMQRLLRARSECPAFHPRAAQEVLELGTPSVFALVRTPLTGDGRVLCLTHFGADAVTLALDEEWTGPLLDLVSGEPRRAPLTLAPYETLWLTHA
jgi:glycosidase